MTDPLSAITHARTMLSIPLTNADGTSHVEPAESRGAAVEAPPHHFPRSHAEAHHFKFVVHTGDGIRELVPEQNGEWTSRPTTEKIYDDPRPLAHLKSTMWDADSHAIVRLPGAGADHEEWFIIPERRTLGTLPQASNRLIPIGTEDPFGHHLIGGYNWSDNGRAANSEG